jgi:hypothetical protein
MRTAALLALLVALAACGPVGPHRGKGLSLEQSLSQRTAIAVRADAGQQRAEPDLGVTLALLYSF